MAKQEDIFKNVISHAKSTVYFSVKRIYDGLSAVYDYAQNGRIKKNIRNIGGNQWFK
jgi:glycyl-tRNA synthetase